MNKNENAVNYVIKLIEKLDSAAKVMVNQPDGFNYYFHLEIQGQRHKIIFDHDIMDDFEIAIKRYAETDYYYTLENAVKFKVYISLGQEGFIPHLDISSELLNEKREWLKDYRVDVVFEKKLCETLYEGLKKISNFLNEIVKRHSLELHDIKEDKNYIDNLIRYYEENNDSLSSQGVEVESIGFLKAAAVCEIIEKEKIKKQETIHRVVKEIDKEIYSIVSELRKGPFIGIRLPECIYEYAKQNKRHAETRIVEKKRNAVKKEEKDKLDKLLEKLDPVLKNKRQGAWRTFNSNNPDRLSQSASSMVELLSQIIKNACKGKKLAEYLKEKYQTKEETEWVEATVKWISKTKTNLQRIKHHTNYKLEKITKILLEHAESIISIILE